MTESNQPTGDASDPLEITRPESEPAPPETAGQESRVAWGAGRWSVVVVVVLLLAYPVARWMMGGGGGAAVTQSGAGGNELQTSFVHYQAGRYEEAVASAKAALAANPNLPDAYNNMAVSYLALRRYDEAVQAAQEAIRLKPDHQLAKNNLAWIQQEKAKSALPPVPAAQASQASTLLNQSVQHYQAGRYKECFDTATESAKLNPSAQAFNNMGICAANLQVWDTAIADTQEALRLDPNFQLAKNNLAWMQQQQAKAGAAKAP